MNKKSKEKITKQNKTIEQNRSLENDTTNT